jgi:hypothetical protein
MTPNKEDILPWPGDIAAPQVIDLNFVAPQPCDATLFRVGGITQRRRAMRFLIVIDSTGNGRQRRSYLLRPQSRGCYWVWTDQREEATEFGSRQEAQQIIRTKMRIKRGVSIVPLTE